MTANTNEYELTIRPARGWFDLPLREMWHYRDLLVLLVHRDFASKYKQTLLGPIWFIIQPLLMTAVFTVIFSGVAKIPTDGLPPIMFYLTGLLGWTYFATTFQTASTALLNNAALLGKVYFPRFVVPLAAVIVNLFAFAVQLATVLCMWAYFKFFASSAETFGFTAHIALLPLLVLQIAALSFGAGLWIAALTVKYRDFSFLVPVLIQIWMYLTPIIYPLSQIPEAYRFLVALNPMAMPTEAVRLMVLGQGVVTPSYLAISVGMTLLLLLTGVLYFNRIERTFVDMI